MVGLLDGSFVESMLQSSLTLGSSIMAGTFNKLDKFRTFKKKFTAEVNLANYFIPIFYYLIFIELKPYVSQRVHNK